MPVKNRAKKGGVTWEEHSRELHTTENQGHKINLINNRKKKDKRINSQSITPSHLPNPSLHCTHQTLFGKSFLCVWFYFVLFQNNWCLRYWLSTQGHNMRGLRKFITWERQGIMSIWPRSILRFVRLSSCSNKSPAKSPGWNGNTTLHRESRHLIWRSVSAVSCNLSKPWFPHLWKEEFIILALSTSRGLWENLKKVNKNFFVNYKTLQQHQLVWLLFLLL